MILKSAMIAGGGTGGHVYPGVAVAEEILRRNPDAKVVFIGTERGMESRILPKLGYSLETITVSRLKGGGIWGRLKGLFRLPIGIFQSWRLLRRHEPQVVLGVGGYASGPALLAAWMTRRPTAIQEQNATPGLTNRWLGKVVRAVFLGFAAGARAFKAKKTVFTGNPIRAALAARLAESTTTAGEASRALRILVFGGSQGARFLNERVPATVAALVAAQPGLEVTVVHQTGPAEQAQTQARWAELGLAERVTVLPFIDDMVAAYAAADLAVCRAGALTVAELTAVGLPSLLVPFPFAADNHQEANAKVLADAGAARLVRQDGWDDVTVAGWLAGLAADRAALSEMAAASRQLARLDAARLIVDRLEGIAR
ncbi:MAG: undecaprenyldiphospho-muramoylpentapeptide beta-N-acetylglucosaminyltransferase [Deltaproteobacteria bacterium]|nr:MAG: undecaprenyldiphospho-muramoylpentapeptide beta-N-acetylglucosaminyltransferase [Deltaproteobacteria bacterium]